MPFQKIESEHNYVQGWTSEINQIIIEQFFVQLQNWVAKHQFEFKEYSHVFDDGSFKYLRMIPAKPKFTTEKFVNS